MRNSTGGWSIWANSMPPWIKEGPPGHHPEPLTPRRLDQLKSAVANFDLSSLVRRQPACALAPGMPPRPVFEEAYFSFDELRHRLLPNVHLMANRWLFQHLTCILDAFAPGCPLESACTDTDTDVGPSGYLLLEPSMLTPMPCSS